MNHAQLKVSLPQHTGLQVVNCVSKGSAPDIQKVCRSEHYIFVAADGLDCISDSPEVLKNLTFTIKSGQRVGIGKS